MGKRLAGPHSRGAFTRARHAQPAPRPDRGISAQAPGALAAWGRRLRRLVPTAARTGIAFLLAISALFTFPTIAHAERWGTATYSGGSYTQTLTQTNALPVTATYQASGLTYTNDATQGTPPPNNNGLADFPQKNASAGMFSPSIPSGSDLMGFITRANTCAGTPDATTVATCSGRGTITITFSRPVTNPRLHIMGLGGTSGGSFLAASGTLTSVPAGATMSTSGGTNLSVAGGNRFETSSTQPNTVCDANAGGNGTAGCGTLQITGSAITSLTFTLAIRVSGGGTSASLGSGAGDHYLVAVSLPDQPMPTANPDTASVVANETVTINPLANDVAASGIALVPASTVFTATSGWTLSGDGKTISHPTYGVFTMSATGTVVFDPVDTYVGAVPPVNYRITDAAGSTASTTITVTVLARPKIILRKTTLEGVGGPYDFTLTNTTLGTGSVTTTVANTPTQADGDATTSGIQPYTATAAGSAVAITETLSSIPADWALSSVNCTNAAGDEVGSLSGTTYTIPANRVVGGAVITCDFRNGKPSISLNKQAGSINDVGPNNNRADAGDTVAYTFTVTNTGQTPLSQLAISDNRVGTVTCSATTVAIGASTTCTATYTLTQADVDAGTVVNTATVTGKPPTGPDMSATDTDTKDIPAAPGINLAKTAGAVNDVDGNGHDTGDTVTYSFEVTNTGNVTLTGVAVTDPKVGPVTCSPTTLAPGASVTCTKTYTLTQDDVNAGVVDNTATASGTPPRGAAVTDTDSASRAITRRATIVVDKQAGTLSGTGVGASLTYTFVVTNTGNVPLTAVTVNDPKVGAITCPATTLAPGASTTCTKGYTVTQADVDAGGVNNTATATGVPPNGMTAPTGSDTTTTPLTRNPAIALDKQTAGTTDVDGNGQDAGDLLNFSFLVTNTGNVTLTGVAVTDPKVPAVSCPVATLAPGASTTCTGSLTLTQADIDSGSVYNTAQAKGDGPSGTWSPTATDSNATPLTPGRAISLDKQAGTPSGTTVGSTIPYTFVITNTGSVTLNAIWLADSKLPALVCPAPINLAPGASATCTGTYPITQDDLNAGSVVNTATVTGYQAGTGAATSATDGATVVLNRTATLTLDKQVGTPTGQTAGSTIVYSFVVTNTGNVALTSLTITDAKVPGANCPTTSLAPGASTTCTATYTLTQADVDAGHVANTATATATPPAGLTPPSASDSTDLTITRTTAITLDKVAGTPTGNAAGSTITYTFLVTNTGSVTLTDVGVADAKVATVTCPTTTLTPGASTLCVATYPITQPDVDSGQVLNTATATGTPPAGMTKPTATDGTTTTLTRVPAITLDKVAGTPTGNTPGSTITYTFTVRNTGNVTLSTVNVSDPLVGTVTCPVATLLPNVSTTCTATYTLTQPDIDAGTVHNAATASGDAPAGVVPGTVSATDTTDTAITAAPALTLDKIAGTPSGNAAGATIGYTFVVKNTGNVTLNPVVVSDPKVGEVNCPATSLAPDATTTCTATYTLGQADADAGEVHNSATATGTPPTGAPITASDTTTTPIPAAPAISLDKQAGVPSDATAGSTIAYTFVVRNTGTVTLSTVGVTDAKVQNLSCPVTTLAPGATTACTGTHTLTQPEVDAGHVANTAIASGEPPTGPAVTAEDSTDTTIIAGPAITLDKQAGAPSGSAAGSTIDYTFVLTNLGNVTLSSVGVTDLKVGAVTCPVAVLAPGATTTCTATYTLDQADVDAGVVDNTATAAGTSPTGTTVTHEDSTSTTIPATPAITLDKQAGLPSGNAAGATIDYTFIIRNTGNVTLTAVELSDPKLGAITCPVDTLAPGATITCTKTHTLSQPDVDAGHFANTATVSGTPPEGSDVTASDATDTTLPAGPAIAVDKQAGTPSGNTAGATIAYTFVVTNNGNVTLSGIVVSDPLVGDVDCPVTSLAPGASTTCTAGYTLDQADVDAGKVDNAATVSGTPPTGSPVTGGDTTSTPITRTPAITLDKQAGTPTGGGAGATIGYTFLVTNTGNVTLTTVGITDPKLGAVTCPVTTLAPGATTTCSGSHTLTQADVDAGHFANTATVTGTPPAGPDVTATDGTDTTIIAGPAISIDKRAGTPSGNVVGATIGYTFEVRNTGNVTLTGVAVNDPKVGAVACPVDTLVPGASTTCEATYALTQADVDAGVVDNTATAAGTPPTGPTVTGTDSTSTEITRTPAVTLDKQAGTPSGNAAGATIEYSFAVANTGNVTLSAVGITDLKVGPVTCPVAVLAPGASTTCTATYSITQADVDAGHVANTALASGNPPTGPPVTATDVTDTTITSGPAIAVVKRAGTPSGNTAGSTIAYTFEVTNTGNVTLSAVHVTDAKVGAVSCPDTTLAPGAATTCTATHTLGQDDVDAGLVTNTATASGTAPGGAEVSAADTVTTPITSAPAITLDKRAGTPSGATAGSTIPYTFVVTNTGNVTLTAVEVDDPLVEPVTCPATTLAPGATTTCTGSHTLSQPEVDAGHVTNTATAAGTPPTGAPATATDSTDSTVPAAPAITLVKRAGTPSGNTAGSTIGYEFVVTNTGNVTLSTVGVSDPKVGPVECPVTTLAPGAETTCSASYPLTQPDVDAGVVDNTATASGTPPSGPAVTDDDSVSTPISATPAVTLDKQAGTPSGTSVGATIGYTFVVTNTGNVTLTAVGVTDLKAGPVTCPDLTLAPGASTTCTATYTLTQADVDAGHVANTATASGTPPTGAAVTAGDSTDTPIAAAPALVLDKRAGTPSANSASGTIDYTFVVTNTGNVTLTAVEVDDPKVGTVTCPADSLAPGASTTCTATYTLTQADVDAGVVDNTAEASGTPPVGDPVTGSDTTSTPITAAPAITLDKQAGTPSGIGAGATVTYSFVVTNTGNVTLSTVGIDDPKVGPVTCPVTVLAPGAATTCTRTYALSQADVDAGHVANTATASGTPPTGAAVTAADSTDTLIPAAPAITIEKTAGTPSGTAAGAMIGYSFVVTNTGNVTLSSVAVTDPLAGDVSCPADALAPGDSTTCTATYPLTQADVDAGRVVNTATASGTPPTGDPVSAEDTVTTTLPRTASLTLEKTAGTPSGVTAGSTIDYEFVVTNTGNTTLTAVHVDDPLVSSVACPVTTLAPGASTTCTGTHTITQAEADAGTVHNTASAGATPPSGVPAPSASDDATVDLARTPGISLDKQSGGVTDGDGNGPDAGDTIGYTFVVANTGNVTLTSVVVTDPKVGPVTCVVPTLAPLATTSCTATYTLTQADVDAGHVPNTAEATGTPPGALTPPVATDTIDTPITAGPAITLDKVAGTPSGTAAGSTVDYEFVVTNTGNVTLATVGVDDPLAAVTCPVGTLAPGATTTCTATYTLDQADVDAGAVTNTATASGTPPTGAPVSAVDSTTTTLPRTATLTLDKQSGTPTGGTAGSTIEYTFVVTNPGNVTVTGVHLTDAKVTPSCADVTLPPGASVTCTATYALTQADVDAGHVANTATVAGDPPAGVTPPSATDSTDTPIPAAPALTLDKRAGTPSGTSAGSTIAYEFTVVNTGNVTLSPVGVDDPKAGTVSCLAASLAPGASTDCTATYTLTQADVDAGHVANTATASGTPPTGAAVTAVDSTDTTIDAAPRLTVVKSAGTPSGSTAGSTIAYSFEVTNTGNVTLSAIEVSDPKAGAVSCPVTSLAPLASVNCTATYTLTQPDVDAGVVDNTATASGTPPAGDPVSATDSISTPITRTPAITLDKRAGAPSGTTAGSTIAYEFVVTNSGNVTLSALVVTDPKAGVVSCPVTSLAPGASTTCTATYTLTQAEVDAGHVANTATVTAAPPAGPAIAATDTTDTPILAGPALTLDKVAGTPSGTSAGSTIAYTFELTNTGNVTLTAVGVSDPLVDPPSCPVTSLAPGASTTCSATYILTQADVDAGVVDNSATASGTPPTGPAVTASDSTSTPLPAAPAITLDKRAGTPSGDTAGSTIAYEFVVTNTGNVTLSALGVTDARVGVVSCPATPLVPGASATCTATYTLTQADVDAGHVANTATASATPPSGAAVTATDSTDTPIAAAAGLTLDKRAGTPSGNTAGSTIAYEFVVTNSGNVTLTAIEVSDPKVGTVSCPVTSLAPRASTTCTATYTLTQPDVDAGHVANTATASGTLPTGESVSGIDSTDTPIAAGPRIALEKTAGTPSGNTAGSTIGYTFEVTNTGNVTLSAVEVSDPQLGAVACPVTSLAPGASTTCTGTYTLTQEDVDAGVVANLATASGTPPTGTAVTATDSTTTPISAAPGIALDKRAGAPTGDRVGATIAYSFTVTNTGNVTLSPVTVNDPLVGAVSCTASELAPQASTDCAATYPLTQADVDAGHVANTATASGTPPTGAAVTAGDSTDTPITSAPAITLDKQAGPPSGTTAGSTVGYTFVVTNSGNVTLTSVGVSDTLVGAVTCPVTTLAPGATTTCTATYTLTQADVDAGVVDNTASASGTPPLADPVSATDSTSTPIPSAPVITLVKQAEAPSGNTAGSTIDYTFTVANGGNVTLDPVSVDDPKLGAVDCPVTSLAPGASVTCTATYTLTQADVDAGVVDNTATAFGNPPSGDPASTADDASATDTESTPIIAAPGLDLEKTGTANGGIAGATVDYEFLLTNTGNVTLGSIGVVDPLVATVTCPVTTLAPGAETTCTATYVLSQDDVDGGLVHNVATASGTPPTGAPITATDSVDVTIVAGPGIVLDKQSGEPSGNAAGGTIDYTFVVTNGGNVTLSGITVDDPMVAPLTCPATTLAPEQSMTCTATYTLTQADVDAGRVVNSATASGTPPTGAAVSHSDGVTTPIAQLPAINLVKAADASEKVLEGDLVDYTFLVTNTGNVTLDGIAVADPMLGLVTCPATTLAPGASMTCTADPYTVTEEDVAAGRVVNEATVTASFCPENGCVVVDSTASVTLTTLTPVVDPEDDSDGDGGDGSLAYTGAGGAAETALLGGGILAAGVFLLAVGRRRRTSTRR